MVQECALPNCTNKMKSDGRHTFHKLPLFDPGRLQLWLVVLQMDPDSPADTLHQAANKSAVTIFTPMTSASHPDITLHLYPMKSAVLRVKRCAAETVS